MILTVTAHGAATVVSFALAKVFHTLFFSPIERSAVECQAGPAEPDLSSQQLPENITGGSGEDEKLWSAKTAREGKPIIGVG